MLYYASDVKGKEKVIERGQPWCLVESHASLAMHRLYVPCTFIYIIYIYWDKICQALSLHCDYSFMWGVPGSKAT